MSTSPAICLASTSATRRQLLAQAGVKFDSKKPLVNEAEVKAAMPSASVKEIAGELSKRKALSLSAPNDSTLIIGADQTLDLDDRLFDKPADEADARRQLQSLRGKTHHLHSGLACARGGKIVWQHTATANLTMRNYSDAELESYITSMGPKLLTSVGGYQIEGLGLTLFEKIEGDYFTILGLPMLPLLAFLRSEGWHP